jgi:hypothetical protein
VPPELEVSVSLIVNDPPVIAVTEPSPEAMTAETIEPTPEVETVVIVSFAVIVIVAKPFTSC